MPTYYNEFDKKKAASLRCLMEDGLITKGEVDDRPIQEVTAKDLQGFTRQHFFAGVGLWDYALQLAGWPESMPVWTGSAPCQPFSSAGKQKGKSDERHLWPEWMRLIRECRPERVYGEQVASSIAFGWLDSAFDDLEAEGYSCGATVLPACSVGAPHKRDRLWFVGNAGGSTGKRDTRGFSGEKEEIHREGQQDGGLYIRPSNAGPLGNSQHDGSSGTAQSGSERQAVQHSAQGEDSTSEFEGAGGCGYVADTECQRPEGQRQMGEPVHSAQSSYGEANQPIHDSTGHWDDIEWLTCPDGKQRPVKSGIRLLATRYPARVHLLHAAGDGIVSQLAAEFIKATKGYRQWLTP